LGSGTDTSSVARSKNDSYDILPTTSTAKNILTVGAVNALDAAPTKSSDIKISDFSSWGPTDDGRIKPDIVGVGVNVFSTSTGSTTSYATLSGTSMSSPQVAGSLFLLQELYAKQNDGQFMRSATLRGLAIHTAEDAGNVG
jgi:subtilisin family serine protease